MYQQRNGIFQSIPPVTLNIIIINVICWIADSLFRLRGIELIQYLGLHYFSSDFFYPHQLITYMFMHAPMGSEMGFFHIFFNMFAVFMFGRTLEIIWGGKKFIFYYVMTGIGAALLNIFVTYLRLQSLEVQVPPEILAQVYENGLNIWQQGMNYTDPILRNINSLINGSMVGASGAVFGILLAFGMMFPNAELMIIFIPIPIKAKYFVVFYGIAELVLGLWNRAGDSVAHFAHLGGLLTGLIIMLYWRKRYGKNSYH